MVIFLKNLPADIKKYEIVSFLNQAYTACRLSTPKVAIRDIEILTAPDVDVDSSEKYAIVKVFPIETGKKILRWLDGRSFKQKPIDAHEFVYRSAGKDPRKNASRVAKDLIERRSFERRCKSSLLIAGTNRPLQIGAPNP
ncbi:MAG: hypothetical protein ACU84H_14785 [Gammaproteobacteria bacterium]